MPPSVHYSCQYSEHISTMADKEQGKFISLAPNLQPAEVNKVLGAKKSQNHLLEAWTRYKELTKEKTWVLGSEVKN